MPLVQVKLIEGVFTAPQKQEIVERLTDAMVEIEGENMREVTWCMVEEVASGEWGIGGHTLTADDVKALARGRVAASWHSTPGLSYSEAGHALEAAMSAELGIARKHGLALRDPTRIPNLAGVE